MKTDTTTCTIRISVELLEDMRVLAREHTRSLNGEILTALREYVTRHTPKGERLKPKDD